MNELNKKVLHFLADCVKLSLGDMYSLVCTLVEQAEDYTLKYFGCEGVTMNAVYGGRKFFIDVYPRIIEITSEDGAFTEVGTRDDVQNFLAKAKGREE